MGQIYVCITELSVTRGRWVPAGIQYGVDATRELKRLEENVYVASRPETVHDEKGKSFDFMKIYIFVLKMYWNNLQFLFRTF